MLSRDIKIAPPPHPSTSSWVDDWETRESLKYLRNPAPLISKYAYAGVTPEYSRAFAWNHSYRFFRARWNDLAEAGIDDPLYLQASAELVAYLASFGMYGVHTHLMTVNKTVFVPILHSLVAHARDLHVTCGRGSYSATDVQELIDRVRNALRAINAEANLQLAVTDTLISKILHGTLACMPAFDSHVRSGISIFNRLSPDILSLTSSTALPTDLERSLAPLYDWACRQDVQAELQRIGATFAPFVDSDGKVLPYPTMRIVDQVFWALGSHMDKLRAEASHIQVSSSER